MDTAPTETRSDLRPVKYKKSFTTRICAKRMEIGAVMAAALRKNVIRETSDPGDVIILLGGRTGRDGIGGATGSLQGAHTEASIEVRGAEVQKGNAPLTSQRDVPRISRLIQECNDFGAGGVSVAIGELADGLLIDLDKRVRKYGMQVLTEQNFCDFQSPRREWQLSLTRKMLTHS